jgi:hypothetical protein
LKQKALDYRTKHKLIIIIFIIFNALNAFTVANFLGNAGIQQEILDDLFPSADEVEAGPNSETQDENQNITIDEINNNDNNGRNGDNTNITPGFIIPILDDFIDTFIPGLSTETEDTNTNVGFIEIDNSDTTLPFNSNVPNQPNLGTSGEGGGGGGILPPVITDCTPTQVVTQNINISCYQGRRTYNTHLITIENTNTTNSCELELELDSSSGPAVTSNFTAGNADIFFIVSTVPNADINLSLLPAPQEIGTWAQWENSPFQVELMGPLVNTPSISETYTIPPNSSRNLGLVMDCGVDTIVSETATIKLKSTFKD